MEATPSETLAEFLQARVGDHLRSVLAYDGDGAEVLYVRDDVADQYSEDELGDIVREARLEAIEKSHQESLYTHGALNCTLRCFDGGVEMHFPRDETAGTVASFDAEVFVTHDTFVGRCMEVMAE